MVALAGSAALPAVAPRTTPNVTVDFTHDIVTTDPLGVGAVITEFGGNPVPVVGNTVWQNAMQALAPGHLRFSLAWYGGNPSYGAGGSPGNVGASGSTATALLNVVKTTIGAIPLVSFNGNSSDNGFAPADAGSIVHFFNDFGGQHGGRIQYWSIGNEPDNSGGVGTYEAGSGTGSASAALAAMLAADPTITVGLPAAAYWDTSLISWAAGQAGVGALSYHAYDGGNTDGTGFPTDPQLYNHIHADLPGYKSGILYGCEEMNWNPAYSGQTQFYDWHNCCNIADNCGQVLSAGGHATVYGDSNGALGLMNDGSGLQSQPGSFATPFPAYRGLGIWTGMNGQFKRYSGHMVSAATTFAQGVLTVYACDNGKIVVVNKTTSSQALTIGVTLSAGVTTGTYNVWATQFTSPTGPIIAAVTAASFTGGTISYTIPGGTAVSIDVTSGSTASPILDESGSPILDESGSPILDESSGAGVSTTIVAAVLSGAAVFPMPTAQPTLNISGLIDGFSANDLPSLWSATYGTVTWSPGQVAVQCDAAYDSALQAAGTWNLIGSAIFAKVGPYIAAGAATNILLQVSNGNNLLFGYAGGSLQVNGNINAAQTTLFSVAYNAATMAWWRVRESAGTTYFDTAPDGVTWTNQFSCLDTVFGIALTRLSVLFQAGVYGANPAGVSYVYAVGTVSGTALPGTLAGSAGFPGLTAPSGAAVRVTPATLTGGGVRFPATALSGGPPTVRSQYTWPFVWYSCWNMPISVNAMYAAPGPNGAGSIGVTFDYSDTIYEATEGNSTLPTFPVKTFSDGYLGNKSVYCDPSLTGTGQWNCTCAFLSTDGDTVYQGQTLELSAGGNPVIGGNGNYVVPGLSITTSTGNPGTHGGSSLSCLGGTITKAELLASGPIPHAMKICFNGLMYYSSSGPGTSGLGWQWPAANADGGYNQPGNVNYYGGSNPLIVEGALMALPPSVNIASRYSDPLVQKIAAAMMNYGAYICDNTASGAGNETALIEINYDAAPYWNGTGTFVSDLLRMYEDLMVVTNSTQNTPGGGAYGTQRRAAFAPPFTTQAKISTLVDNFASNDLASTWAGSAGTVAWSSGQMAVRCDTSYDSYLRAAATYDLTGSSFYAKVAPYIAPFAATNIQLQVSAGNNILFGYSGGQLAVYSNINGVQTNLFTTTYSATAHAWWRVRESGGSVFFDSSPDGATWTNQYSAADYVFGFPLTQLNATFQCGDYGGDAAGTSFVYFVNETGSVAATAAPAVLPGSAAFPAPAVGVGTRLTTSLLSGSAAFPAPTPRAGSGLTTGTLPGSAAFPAPAVVATGGVTLVVLAKATAFPAVVVHANITVTPPTLAGSAFFGAVANAGSAPSTFIGTLPGNVGLIGDPVVQTGMVAAALPPGYPGGPAGVGATLSPAVGTGWEILVRSGADYTTLLAVIPPTMLMNWQFVRQLDDLGSGTVTLSQDDPWWQAVTLPGGLPATTLLDEECLWQVWQDDVCRFEFFGETVTEQLVDPSEQRIVTVTGPGVIAALKWAMVAPAGFPDIVQKLDGIQDSFDEVDDAGNGVLDVNIWTTASPGSHIYITPTLGLYNYPGGAGYALSTLYPSGSLTVVASPETTFLGASPYDATDTLVSAQVTPVGVNANAADSLTPAKYGTGLNGSELTQMYVESNLDTSYYALFGLSASAFYCQFRGPAGVYTKILPAYNAENHAYWMITEQGGTGGGSGTFYFWTSPDGQTWTKQWVIVHNWDATDVSLYFTAFYSVDNKVSAQLTNLNSNVTTPSYQGSIYLGVPMMGVWLDQFRQAQARGTARFVATRVSAAADSYGRAWTDTQNVQAVNGTDLYTLLQSGTSVVNADYVMNPGFELVIGQPAAGEVSLGVDRSQYLILREGLDCAAKQRIRARNLITTSVGGENADGHEISASSPAFAAQWGQREAWYQTAVQVDPVSMAYATAAALAQNETEVESWTLTITPNITGKTVFKNFDVGDWLGLEEPDFAGIDDIRVTAIAIAVDSSGNETHELTLVSYIQWLQEQLTYISNRLGGQFVNVIGTSPVAPSKYGTGQVPTYFDPAATLAGLGDVATGSAGSGKSNAPLVYNAATGQYQAAGTTDPVSGSALPMAVSGPGAAQVITTQLGTVVVDAGGSTRVTTGLQPDGTVTVVSANGPAPAVPDAPSASGGIQSVTVGWDGLLSGTAPLLDFQYAEVYLGTSPSFAPGPGTLMGTLMATGQVTIGGLTAGATYWAKLVAVNDSGNSSAPSAAAAATATGVPGGIITGQIPASLLGNSAGSWALNPNPFFNGGDLTGWAFTGATLTAAPGAPLGAPGAPAYVALLAATAPNGLMQGSPAPFPVTAGQPYSMTTWAYNPGGSPATAEIGFSWPGGLQSFTVPPGVWTPLATVQTAPATGTAYQVIQLPTSGTSLYVSGAVAAGQVSGQLIAADSVTADQIAAGIILAGIVNGTTIEGAQFVSYGAGGEVLVYSGTPAVGNLVGSWSAIAGNDAAVTGGVGNGYPPGLMIGPPGSSQVTLIPNSSQPFNVTTAIAGTLTAMAQLTTGDTAEAFPGIVGALNLGSGAAAKQTLVASSPFASTVGAAMLLESENDGGTDLAVVTFGTISSPDASTIVFTPLMMLTPYAMVMYSGPGTQVIVTKTGGTGTIPIPAGVAVAKGETWAASGGSGGSGELGGAGGGGSEYACEPALAVTGSGTVGYSVGAAGSAGSAVPGAGGAGGNSSLTGSSVTVTAHGGQGGAANGGAGGAGGTGSANTIAEHGGVGGFSPATFDGGGGGGGSAGPNGPGFAGGVAGGTNGGAGALATAGGGAGGAGGFGNHTGFGQAGFAGTAPGGGAGGPGGSFPGAGTVVGRAGSPGQVRLTYMTQIPAVGQSVNYGAPFADQYGNVIPAGMRLVFAGTSVAVASGTGMTGHLPVSQVDTALVGPVTGTGLAALSKAWPVPAGDAQAGTAYRLTVGLSGVQGSTAETLQFALVAFGATLAVFTIGGLEWLASAPLGGTLTCEIVCVSGTSARSSIRADLNQTSANELTVANTVNAGGGFGTFAGAQAISNAAPASIQLQAAWGVGTTGCSITSGYSILERLGA